jgi:hypothetical protein
MRRPVWNGSAPMASGVDGGTSEGRGSVTPTARGIDVGDDGSVRGLLVEEPDVHYAAIVLFVADDPGVFGSAVVDIQHIDVESVFVVREIDTITGAGSAILVKAELWVIQIKISGGWNGHGIFTDQDGHRLYYSMGCLAVDAAVIRLAVYFYQVGLRHHQLVFRRHEETGLYDDLDIVILECHKVGAVVCHGDGLKLGLADAFVYAGQGEGGHVGADVLVRYFGEIVFFAAEVGEVEVLGDGGEAGKDKEEKYLGAHTLSIYKCIDIRSFPGALFAG